MTNKRMKPVHSRPRLMRSNRGLSQYGGWLAASVRRLPEFDLVQHLTRRRGIKTPQHVEPDHPDDTRDEGGDDVEKTTAKWLRWLA